MCHVFDRFSLAHLNVVSPMNNDNAETMHVKYGNWVFNGAARVKTQNLLIKFTSC